MPTISVFYGFIIKMFFDDHAPPHFHVQYAEFKATINVETLELNELLEDWQLCQMKHLQGVVTWPGEIDLAPDAMYKAIQQNGEWLLD
jgi:hypothetical protein